MEAHHRLLDTLDDQDTRDLYAAAITANGWSRDVLVHQIRSLRHRRAGAAPSNFAAQLPATDSDLAQQLVRDPYVFDLLDLIGHATERELEMQ